MDLAVCQSLQDVEEQFFGQGLELGLARHLVVVFDTHVEGVPLHVVGATLVGRLQDLDDVVHRHVALQVVLAKHLKPVVGENVERGRCEQVEGVLGRHPNLAVVDVTQEAVDALPVRVEEADEDIQAFFFGLPIRNPHGDRADFCQWQ